MKLLHERITEYAALFPDKTALADARGVKSYRQLETETTLTALGRFLRQEAVTHMFLPASLAAILAEDYDISGRNIFAAGEKLRNFRPHTAGNFLINSYGSTELGGEHIEKDLDYSIPCCPRKNYHAQT